MRYRLLWLVSLVFVVWMIWAETSFQYFEHPVAQELKLTPSSLSLVVAAFLLPYGLMQVPVGWILDRGVAERWLIGSAAMAAVLTSAFGLSGDFYGLLLSRAGMGLVCAVAFPASALLAHRALPPQRFALAIGFTDSLLGVGASLAALMPLFLAPDQWRLLAWFQSGALILLVVLPAFALTRRIEVAPRALPVPTSPNARWSASGRRRVLLAALIYAWGGGLIFGLAQYGLISGLQQWSTGLKISASFSLSLGMSLGMVLSGWFGSVPKRRAPMLLSGAVAVSLAFCVLVLAQGLAQGVVIAVAAVLGLGVGTAVLAFPMAEDAAPAGSTALAAALVNSVGTLTGALMTAVSGLILQLSRPGDTSLVLVVYGLLCCAGIVVALLAQRLSPAPQVA